jgi:hypothetical protein
MEAHVLETHQDAPLTVDLCFPCHAMWFDQTESLLLSASATLELCRLIQTRGAGDRRPLANRMSCPRCTGTLRHAHDLTRSGQFFYYRCDAGHGRMTPFFQFLREKHFVRTLSAAEIERLRRVVREVRCSSCGAPVSIERDARCGHCGTAVAMLDPEAVERAVAALADARRPRAEDGLRTARAAARSEELAGSLAGGTDLVVAGLRALSELFAALRR